MEHVRKMIGQPVLYGGGVQVKALHVRPNNAAFSFEQPTLCYCNETSPRPAQRSYALLCP